MINSNKIVQNILRKSIKRKLRQKDVVVGQKIVNVRLMTPEEYKKEDWEYYKKYKTVVIELDNGLIIFASKNINGNTGPGVLFGRDKFGQEYDIN